MMQLAALDLEKEFGRKPNGCIPPHPLKQFFYERQITYAGIAKVIGISKQSVFFYLANRYPFPEKYEAAMYALADRVKEWERKKGKKFNTEEPIKPIIRRAIKLDR